MALLVQSRLPRNGTISTLPSSCALGAVEHPRAAVDTRVLDDEIREAGELERATVGGHLGVELVGHDVRVEEHAEERARVDELVAVHVPQDGDLRDDLALGVPLAEHARRDPPARRVEEPDALAGRVELARVEARLARGEDHGDVALELADGEAEAPALIVGGPRRNHPERHGVLLRRTEDPRGDLAERPVSAHRDDDVERIRVQRARHGRGRSSVGLGRKELAPGPALAEEREHALDPRRVLAALRRRVRDQKVRAAHGRDDRMGLMRCSGLFGVVLAAAGASIAFAACGGGGSDTGTDGGGNHGDGSVADDGAVVTTPQCQAQGGSAPVAQPTFVRNLKTGETGWFSSAAVVDLDKNGKKEIVAPFYSTFVYDAQGKQIGKGTATGGRVYAPGVVADLDGDGTTEIVVGGSDLQNTPGTSVVAYEWKNETLVPKAGWPVSTCSGGQCPEVRGMAAGDLDGDGKIEIVVTTTNTSDTGAQVFVFEPDGSLRAGWPRYNQTDDVTFNGQGNSGYGCYGENVGIGDIDDDADLEVLVTYDDHQINAFKKDGTSILASDWYTNPQSQYFGMRMGWGQFIRWFDPTIEDSHYHFDPNGAWPSVDSTMWLQWTASPPNVVDVDGDGKNDVVGIPNAEEHEPYETQGYAFMVLQGAQGGGANAARRLPAFTNLPFSDKPAVRASDDYYPPSGIPAPTTVNILGDARPEIVAPINDGYVYAIGPDGTQLWRYDYAKGQSKTFASEVVVADLNQDGIPELVFGTYSLEPNGGHLVVLENTGALLWDIVLPNQGSDGNGIGVPAAPTLADLDGDGQLDIVVSTFDHGIDVFTVPGSGTSCMLWPTGRGLYLRAGRPMTP